MLGSSSGSDAHDEAHILRQYLIDCRQEAESLRVDLGDATALIEALEGELWAVTARWWGPDQVQAASGALNHLIQARSLIRRTLFQERGSESERAAALRDLRIAEATFGFLVGLRILRVDTHPP